MQQVLRYARWLVPVGATMAFGAVVISGPPEWRERLAAAYSAAVYRKEEPPPAPAENPFRLIDADGKTVDEKNPAEPVAVELSEATATAMGLRTLEVRPAAEPVVLRLTGKTGLNMERVAHVKLQFGGKIVDIGPQLGSAVKGPGEPGGPTPLCVIESVDLANAKSDWLKAKVQSETDDDALAKTERLVAEQAQSVDLSNAKSDWLKAKVQLELDEDNLRRTRELVARKVLADKFLIDAESAVKKSRTDLEAAALRMKNYELWSGKILQDAKAAARKSKADLEAARQRLKVFGLEDADFAAFDRQQGRERMLYTVTAPRSGIIAEKNVTRGEVTDTSGNLFTIADLSTVWVWGDVYERDWPKVRVGQKAKVYVSAHPDEPRDAAVEFVAPGLDAGTRSIRIRCSLDNSDGRLLADMYATLAVTVDDGAGSLVVPATAVLRKGSVATVMVRAAGPATAGGKLTFARRTVTVETVDSQRLRVTSGLTAGETVVVRGALGLSNEMER
jgi:RND family efflux transporter MFP subunit